MRLKFHDGLKESIDVDRMTDFDVQSILEPLYDTRSDVDASQILEELGPWALDYTNLYDWSENTPDVHTKGSRLFQLWAEDTNSGKVVGVVRGHLALVPFTWSAVTLRDYYKKGETAPFYPMAIITSLRSTLRENRDLDIFLDRTFKEIRKAWTREREEAIVTIQKDSELWRRYVASFEEIIHFTILCPSIHRRLIDALKRKDYRISGVMQLLASTSNVYDKATIDHHIRNVEKVLKKSERAGETSR